MTDADRLTESANHPCRINRHLGGDSDRHSRQFTSVGVNGERTQISTTQASAIKCGPANMHGMEAAVLTTSQVATDRLARFLRCGLAPGACAAPRRAHLCGKLRRSGAPTTFNWNDGFKSCPGKGGLRPK